MEESLLLQHYLTITWHPFQLNDAVALYRDMRKSRPADESQRFYDHLAAQNIGFVEEYEEIMAVLSDCEISDDEEDQPQLEPDVVIRAGRRNTHQATKVRIEFDTPEELAEWCGGEDPGDDGVKCWLIDEQPIENMDTSSPRDLDVATDQSAFDASISTAITPASAEEPRLNQPTFVEPASLLMEHQSQSIKRRKDDSEEGQLREPTMKRRRENGGFALALESVPRYSTFRYSRVEQTLVTSGKVTIRVHQAETFGVEFEAPKYPPDAKFPAPANANELSSRELVAVSRQDTASLRMFGSMRCQAFYGRDVVAICPTPATNYRNYLEFIRQQKRITDPTTTVSAMRALEISGISIDSGQPNG